MGLCICMFKKYFYIGVLLLCICFCINGVAATDNVTYDNGNYLSDGNQVISESIVNKSNNPDMVESINNDSVSNKDSGGVSNFNKHNFMSIQSSNYYGNVFNENTGIYYDDLQQAIFSAWEGNKLIVYGGYYENIILSRNDLTITCVNQYNSTIDNLHVNHANGCNISGFTINSMELDNSNDNIFCNNLFDHYYKPNPYAQDPIIMLYFSHDNLFESNEIKLNYPNFDSSFIYSQSSSSIFKFNIFYRYDLSSCDINTFNSYLNLDNNLWSLSEDLNVLNNILINNQGSDVVLDNWIVPKFNIVDYKPVIDFNFNNFNEDVSFLGSIDKMRIILYIFEFEQSQINNGYLELDLSSGINFFHILFGDAPLFFGDESFIFNRNTSNYYKNLQEAIDDVYTLNGHTLELCGSHSSGDLFIHKNLTINGFGLIINNFLINEGGSGSKISNFNIKNLTIKNSNYLNILNNQIDNLLINNSNFNTFFSNNIKNITEILNSNNSNLSNNRINSIYIWIVLIIV